MEIHGCSPRQGQADADANALRALYIAMMDGWNRGSAEAFAAPFVDDLEFVAFDGTRFRGRSELVRSHEPLFRTHLKGTRLVGDVTDVRFLGHDAAVVHAQGGTIIRGRSTPSPERDSIQTLVAVKREGEWRLVAFQNTRVRPIGRNVLGTLCWLVGDWFWKWCGPANTTPGPPEGGHYAGSAGRRTLRRVRLKADTTPGPAEAGHYDYAGGNGGQSSPRTPPPPQYFTS